MPRRNAKGQFVKGSGGRKRTAAKKRPTKKTPRRKKARKFLGIF